MLAHLLFMGRLSMLSFLDNVYSYLKYWREFEVKLSVVMNTCTKHSDNFFSVCTTEDAYELIENFETRNTVKVSCYKASKGFGNTGKQLYLCLPVMTFMNKAAHSL